MKKLYKYIISFALLITALSIGYYYVIAKPQIDRERHEQEQTASENSRKAQEQADYQNWVNELRKECESDREKAVQQAEDIINSCKTDECIDNVAKTLPGTDYISNCIDRKRLEVQNSL